MSDETWVVTMPKLGETVTEGTIDNWLKQVGDAVAFDDPLFEVSTDKVNSDIPSPYDGVILEIMVQAGETVPVGTEVVRIGPPGSTPGAAAPDGSEQGGSASDAGAGGAASTDPDQGQSGFAEGAGTLHEITMPKLGETVTEGTISAWMKEVGDTVEFDDPLYEVSTDKVDSDIPSPYDGVLVEILVPAGETVPVGTVVARIGDPNAKRPESSGAVRKSHDSGGTAQPSRLTGQTPPAVPGQLYSPIVRRLAAENGIDLRKITGSGEGGRIRREDVEAAIASGSAPASAPAASAPAVASAPAAASASGAASRPAGAGLGPASEAPPMVGGTNDPRDDTQPLSKMRIAVANSMIRSLQTAPQVWTSIEVDWQNVEETRQRHKAAYKKATGASLSYLTFTAKAVVEALLKFPPVNSSVDFANKQQVFHPYVNLGIAVDMDEKGLIVPVVKDADQLNLKGLGIGIKKQAELGRAGKLPMDDMTGSTFTITNVGPYESYASAPIINQPNAGILCLDGLKKRPVVVDGDMIAIHPTGFVGLVYDHRAFDGVTASKFLMEVRNILQERDWDAELGL